MREKSEASRTTSSKSKIKMNPGMVDDSTVEDLKGFRQAKNTRDDPAYKVILAKCGKGSMESHGTTISTLTPKPYTTHEDFKDWSRGKASERP